MSSDTKTNVGGTAPMSLGVPRNDKSNKQSKEYDRAYDAMVPDIDLTDAEYLRRQGERAKAAIMGAATVLQTTVASKAKETVSNLRPGAKDANDADGAGSSDAGSGGPMKMVKEHPWATVGAATAVGFLGAVYLNPTRFGRLKSRIQKLEKKITELQEEVEATPVPRGKAQQDAGKTAAKSSILSSLGTLALTQGMNALKPLMAQYIAPIMAGEAHQQQQQQQAYEEYMASQQPTPETESAVEERFAGNPPPRSAGDPSI